MKPTFDPKALDQMQARIDSVSAQLALGDLPFDMAVLQHSTRDETRNQKGQVVNPRDGGTRFGVDELDPNIFFLLQDLEEGSISAPVQLMDADKQAYWAIIKLDEQFPAHRANPRATTACFHSRLKPRSAGRGVVQVDWAADRGNVCPGRFALQGVPWTCRG